MKKGVPSGEFYDVDYRGMKLRCLYKEVVENGVSKDMYYLVLGPELKAVDSPAVKEFEHLRRDPKARAQMLAERAALEKKIQLKVVAGTEDSEIKLFLRTFDTVRRRSVSRQIIGLFHTESGRTPDSLWMKESVVVDMKGRIDVKYALMPIAPPHASVYRVRFGDAQPGELPPRASVQDMYIEGQPLNVALNIGN
jgi:hypothetical protein